MTSNWTKYFQVPASFSSFKPYVDPEQRQNGSTVKPQYNAPAFNLILPKEHKYFGAKKYIHSYLHVGNSENLSLKHNFSQSLEMRYSGVKLQLKLVILKKMIHAFAAGFPFCFSGPSFTSPLISPRISIVPSMCFRACSHHHRAACPPYTL